MIASFNFNLQGVVLMVMIFIDWSFSVWSFIYYQHSTWPFPTPPDIPPNSSPSLVFSTYCMIVETHWNFKKMEGFICWLTNGSPTYSFILGFIEKDFRNKKFVLNVANPEAILSSKMAEMVSMSLTMMYHYKIQYRVYNLFNYNVLTVFCFFKYCHYWPHLWH